MYQMIFKVSNNVLLIKKVIYMTSRAMQTMYAHGLGRNPCRNVVLIVDEVDGMSLSRVLMLSVNI
jgi:hypothetical protein